MYVKRDQLYDWIALHEGLLHGLIDEARKKGTDSDVTFYKGGLAAISYLKTSVETRLDSEDIRQDLG
ncbi:hypothetical protein MKX31_28330 [Bacillus sp. FSL M8-0063]|uniref:hypothetical protein n=1 Tax=Bacillus sp. FSL M8-0063 TaxID=2921566 RepID=UPI0030F51A66